MAIFVRQ